MALKIPFGIRDNQIVMIEDLSLNEKGLACNCKCPCCNGDLEARLGDIRTHHFAHNKESCDITVSFLNGMYMLVKEFVDTVEFKLPALKLYWKYYSTPYTKQNFFSRIKFQQTRGYNETTLYKETTLKFDSSEIVYKNKLPIAIIMRYRNNNIALRIKPPATLCKSFRIVKYQDMATLCLDATNIKFETLNKINIAKLLANHYDLWYWVYSPKAINALYTLEKQNDHSKSRSTKTPNKQKEEAKTPKKAIDYSDKIFEHGYKKVKNRNFYQNNEIIYDDVTGCRWVECKSCGKKDTESKFYKYGSPNELNLGICLNCAGKRLSFDNQKKK